MNTKFTLGAAAALAAAGLLGVATLGMAQDDAPTTGTATATVTDATTQTTTAGNAAEKTGISVPADRRMTIWRDPNCGCCDAYADYMEGEGYQITRIDDRDFDKTSISVGVPKEGLGCHLAKVDGYFVSGLVPAEIVQRLTRERPDVIGITLPGMPRNAPGMAGKSGTLKTYAFADDGVTVYSNE
ncbi:DUF411 domain-containing protein [Brevirhabdus sp.]|uniref:DUF411 domain-containing protein n=1 Tax=Brevirhabdus sp. TaxID=2004514 RepID=UPI004058DCDD